MSVPHNLEAEGAVLGAILTSEKLLDTALLDTRLRPEHFYRDTHRTMYRAMVDLRDAGQPIDVVTIGGDQNYAQSLVNTVPSLSAVGEYARIVREKAALRGKLRAAQEIQAAVAEGDWQALERAEARLHEEDARGGEVSPDQLAERLSDHVEQGLTGAIPTPFRGLNVRASGGLLPGRLTLIGGWTSHGKSATAGQLAVHAAEEVGADVRYYLTADMTPEEAGLRIVAHRSDIPLSRLMMGDLREVDYKPFTQALNELPFPFVEAYDWRAEEIAHDIRRHKPDLWVVDILHEIDYETERDLARMSRAFNRVAMQTNTHGIVTVHLNDGRLQGGQKGNNLAELPQPVLRDIKGASALKQGAANVLFVWRENTADAIKRNGRMYWAKVRGGKPGGIDVAFNGSRMRFTEGHVD